MLLFAHITYSFDLLHTVFRYYMFQLMPITCNAELHVEPTDRVPFATAVPLNNHHVIETQTAIPGWETSERQERTTIPIGM
jgi:hypothetical protein